MKEIESQFSPLLGLGTIQTNTLLIRNVFVDPISSCRATEAEISVSSGNLVSNARWIHIFPFEADDPCPQVRRRHDFGVSALTFGL